MTVIKLIFLGIPSVMMGLGLFAFLFPGGNSPDETGPARAFGFLLAAAGAVVFVIFSAIVSLLSVLS